MVYAANALVDEPKDAAQTAAGTASASRKDLPLLLPRIAMEKLRSPSEAVD